VFYTGFFVVARFKVCRLDQVKYSLKICYIEKDHCQPWRKLILDHTYIGNQLMKWYVLEEVVVPLAFNSDLALDPDRNYTML
jgi:hypothetical protein